MDIKVFIDDREADEVETERWREWLRANGCQIKPVLRHFTLDYAQRRVTRLPLPGRARLGREK